MCMFDGARERYSRSVLTSSLDLVAALGLLFLPHTSFMTIFMAYDIMIVLNASGETFSGSIA